jgi:hypothetical protein
MELKSAFDILGDLCDAHVLWFAAGAVALIIMTSSALAALGSRNTFLSSPRHSRRSESSLWHHQLSSDVLTVNGNGGHGQGQTLSLPSLKPLAPGNRPPRTQSDYRQS